MKYTYNNGLFTGTSATTFAPYDTMTRAMMVTVLYRMAGEPDVAVTSTGFTDLDADRYYYNAVLWAVEKGITMGTDATHFAPNDPVTREQMVTFLYRYAKLTGMDVTAGADITTFADHATVGASAADAMWHL